MTTAVQLKNVTKHYANGKGIQDVNLSVNVGEIFGFLGPNGAGKTTTIRCIMDFIRPQHGNVRVFGLDSHLDSSRIKARLGYLPADLQLYENWTGSQHVDFYKSVQPSANAKDIAVQLDLDLSQRAGQLSTGNRQKLALLLALLGKPDLLIMDEPTKGLDPLLQQTMYDMLHDYRKSGGTVIISSHNLPEVEKICDRVGIIKGGSIIATESLETIHARSIRTVSLTAHKPIEKGLFSALTNVEVTHHSHEHVLLRVKGDLNPLLKTIARINIKELEIAHANLEDVFMEYYR